jgi:alanyl-tRNA synthetase
MSSYITIEDRLEGQGEYSSPPPTPNRSPSPILVTPEHSQLGIHRFVAYSGEETEEEGKMVEEQEDDLYCYEELSDYGKPNRKHLFQVAQSAMEMAHQYVQEIEDKLNAEILEKIQMRTRLNELEEQKEVLEHEKIVEKNINQILKRGIKRMRDMVMRKFPELDKDEECSICVRKLSDLKLVAQIDHVRLGCCLKPICVQCLLRHAHVQHQSSPKCPFCRQLFC